jgi:uncharacterized protein
VRLLLPPSEAKNPGGRGRPLDVRTVPGPLVEARDQALDALAALVAGTPEAAAAALLLPPGVADAALAADARVRTSATTPALRRYSGVVYDGLGYASLPVAVQRTAHRSVLIFSGLFGIVRGDEPIPDYRVPAKAVLPGLGIASAYWRRHLQQLFHSAAGGSLLGRGLLVDLRSGDYAAMWRPPRAAAERVVAVRVLSPLPRGGHGVVSYTSKFGKGRLAAELLHRTAGAREPATRDDVAAAWLACGGRDAVPTATGLDLHTS